GRLGGLIAASAATSATATVAIPTAAVALGAFRAFTRLVVVRILAVEGQIVVALDDLVVVLVFVVIGAVVEVVVQVGQRDRRHGRDEVLVGLGALDRMLVLGQGVVDLDDDRQAALLLHA